MTESPAAIYYTSPEAYIGKRYELSPPSKLNLRLKVEGRKPDGFHLLSMLNVTTSLCDELTVTFQEEKGIVLDIFGSSDPILSDPQKNIAALAATRFLEEFQIPLGVKIGLKKNIPIGSGLGGGSSDAASILKLLSACFAQIIETSQNVNKQSLGTEVARIAASVGSDVTFFLKAGFARVTGIGEKVERYDGLFLNDIHCAIVIPKASISTKDLYEAFRKKHPVITPLRDMPGERFGEMLRLNTAIEGYEPIPSRTIRASLWRQLLPQISNDLEPTVCETYPLVGETLELLRKIPETVAGVTGSGSGIFVLPRTFDFFETQGTGALRNALAGRDVNIFEIRLKS
jgi:4-diphosphocytidyl-2-C-methyl-D-erythritol kinase